MTYSTTYKNVVYSFKTLGELLAKASSERSGDQLAGIAANSQLERVLARVTLSEVPLTDFLEHPLIAPEKDEVTRLILESHDREAFRPLSSFTVGELRDFLLQTSTNHAALERLTWGLTPEMVAAVSKLMRNQDLIAVARKRQVVTGFRTTVGLEGRLATRLQPNHPSDDLRGILASTLDGLSYGAGDAVIGINPASDGYKVVLEVSGMLARLLERYEIPTQTCVLSHITATLEAIERGAEVDLIFQSVAGTEQANKSFGIDLALLEQGYQAGLSLNRGTVGQNVMYFETGQGNALSSESHHDLDQQTLEARAYAVARKFKPFLVNTVVGFIGPEYLYNGKQIVRAGLEDHFCGKLLGLPMGVDICYTNHAEADGDDMDTLLSLLGLAGVNFIMGVPGADDIMLGYQSTSFHDALYLREVLNLKPAPEFEVWLEERGMMQAGKLSGDVNLMLEEGIRGLERA